MPAFVFSFLPDTFVMKITATDADEPNNLNSKIAYKIESQSPSGPLLFILNTENGELHIAKALDREVNTKQKCLLQRTIVGKTEYFVAGILTELAWGGGRSMNMIFIRASVVFIVFFRVLYFCSIHYPEFLLMARQLYKFIK